MKKKVSILALTAGLAAIVGLTGCAGTESAAATGGAEVTNLRYQGSANNVSRPTFSDSPDPASGRCWSPPGRWPRNRSGRSRPAEPG